MLAEEDEWFYTILTVESGIFVGHVAEVDRASTSGTSDESLEFSRKRPRKESATETLFDLNLPADAH